MTSVKGVFLLLGLLAQTLLAFASTAHPRHDDHDDDYDDDRPVPKRGLSTRANDADKYFHEAGGSVELGHYDGRFYHGKVAYDERRGVLRDLIRSYLTVCEQHGIETWLAHGTLLGWWWNGQVMPFDTDLDVQVSNETLFVLGDTLNRTEHVFNRTEGALTSGNGSGSSPDADAHAGTPTPVTYLLDINPHHVEIDRGDRSNIIDARWIDTSTGMFIDITGLREREPRRPGVWSCKNKHNYDTQDLWPLRVSEFEGVRAKVPYSFEKILVDEYRESSLQTEHFEQHRWDHDIKDWVSDSP